MTGTSTEYFRSIAASALSRRHLADDAQKIVAALDAWRAGRMAKDKARSIVYAAAGRIDEATRPLTGAELREKAEWVLLFEEAMS